MFLLLGINASAQRNYDSKISEISNDVYAIDYAESRAAILRYVERSGVKLVYQSERDKMLTVRLIITPESYKSYDSLVNKLGFTSAMNINVNESDTRMKQLELELNFLREKRDSYTELTNKLSPSSSNYIPVWTEIQSTNEKIFEKTREKLNVETTSDIYSVTLTLHDEVTSPENTRVSFVNMPGIEYSYLSIETPQKGISAGYYHGYFLKYLFTRGKSYGNIGIYKNNDISKTDSVAYSELFVLGFGQDFYSRHFGRGSRKFFNLYSGYTAGCILATSEVLSTKYIPYLSPSIGVELYKNKYILIDTKVSYLVPLINSRNMRGISYGASFNFVF